MKRIYLIIGMVLFAHTAFADNSFDVHFDAVAPFMKDADTMIFNGIRIDGGRLSATNDALRLEYNFDYKTSNFALNRENVQVYSNIGVFNEEHMTADVLVAQPSFVADEETYRFGETNNFEASSSKPLMLELNLQAGHVVSWILDNPSNNFTYKFTGENIDS